MLKLFRNTGQHVMLNVPNYPHTIGVVVLGVSANGCVQLGFEAPREVVISRDDARVKKLEDEFKKAVSLEDGCHGVG